jgi:regulator of RNase E activity RraA
MLHDIANNPTTTLQMLARAGTASVANALLRQGLRNTCLGGLAAVSPGQRPMAGPAFTLRFIPAREDIDSMAAYARPDNLHRRAIEECPAGAVLVIDTHGETRASSAGDMMAARLLARGAAGLVTDGGLRDAAGIREVGLPAYQRHDATPATPIHLHPVELNAPIGCAGVAIYPGDIMVGDASGVVAVPASLAEQIAREAWDATQYEVFAALQIAKGRSLLGLFPSTPESLAEYKAWVAAGRPPL